MELGPGQVFEENSCSYLGNHRLVLMAQNKVIFQDGVANYNSIIISQIKMVPWGGLLIELVGNLI
ncbi:hypothetical protein MTR_2g086900 [Medicago truncatula]|uniref:Uncharacterized protein n=1 Tax=Medicago truncatula TaxID=3880 RepID=G7IHH2_MEDTR|nr:hypothetical protein MTR_2g086900 [Medicago truncatula]